MSNSQPYHRSSVSVVAIIAVVVFLGSLGLVLGVSSPASSHLMAVTQDQYMSSTQSQYQGPGSSRNCGSNSCVYPTCGANGCSFQVCTPNGCLELQVPVANSAGNVMTSATQFFALHNLPPSLNPSNPSIGSWVTVTGSLHQGANTSSNGAACPGNYFNLTSSP